MCNDKGILFLLLCLFLFSPISGVSSSSFSLAVSSFSTSSSSFSTADVRSRHPIPLIMRYQFSFPSIDNHTPSFNGDNAASAGLFSFFAQEIGVHWHLTLYS